MGTASPRRADPLAACNGRPFTRLGGRQLPLQVPGPDPQALGRSPHFQDRSRQEHGEGVGPERHVAGPAPCATARTRMWIGFAAWNAVPHPIRLRSTAVCPAAPSRATCGRNSRPWNAAGASPFRSRLSPCLPAPSASSCRPTDRRQSTTPWKRHRCAARVAAGMSPWAWTRAAPKSTWTVTGSGTKQGWATDCPRRATTARCRGEDATGCEWL